MYCRELEQAEGLAASGQGAGPYGSRRIRFRDFANEFEEYKAAHVKSSSLKRYKTALKIFVYAFGDRYLTGITQADIERYIAARSRAVKPWTVVGEITILKQMFNVSLAFHTGMRRGELLGLTRDRIRLDQRTIFLPDTKMGESQTVHLNDSAAEELRAIPCEPGNPRVLNLGPKTLECHFRKACQKAGLSDLRFRDCRHTFCSRLVELGANLRAVQALARHKQISMTMRYAHLRDDYLGETVRLLNGSPDRNLVRSSGPSREKG